MPFFKIRAVEFAGTTDALGGCCSGFHDERGHSTSFVLKLTVDENGLRRAELWRKSPISNRKTVSTDECNEPKRTSV